MIDPIGGILVERGLDDAGAAGDGRRSVGLDPVALADLELLATGAYSPLDGFMTRADYAGVVEHAKLASGTVWTLPITLPVPADEAAHLAEGDELALRDETGALRGTLKVRDVFERDLEREAGEVYRTTNPEHPGVAALLATSRWVVGGPVRGLVSNGADGTLSPAATRAEFVRRGWS